MEEERIAALEALLEETIAVTRENNRLIREMRRNAILGFVARIVVWLIVLGVPLFFLSSYLGPIIEALSGSAEAGALPNGMFGLPSSDELQRLMEQYRELTGDTGN